jgi:subtilisin family serine protease
MFRSPLGRKLSVPTRAARRLVLVLSLFAVAASLPFINAGASQQQEDKPTRSQPTLKGEANIVEGAEFVPGDVLVRFRTDAAAKTAEAAPVSLRATGGGDVTFHRFEGSEIVRGLRLAKVEETHTLEAVAELAARPDVLYAEPNYIWRTQRTPNDPRFAQQYGLSKINATAAWDTTIGNRSVVVGVLDGGVDTNHEDLRDNIWTNTGEVPANGFDDDGNGLADDVHGWDFDDNNSSIFDGEDGDDHATHVAGTIGAEGDNNLGVTGVNWEVSLMSLKVLGPDGGSVANIIKGYNYALQMRQRGVNLRVLNNSYGGPGKSLSALAAIQQLNNAGILFVVAAGNSARDNFTYPDYPASYDSPNVIAVAATTNTDSLSSFSNFGARLVSIGAPGGGSAQGIVSTVPPSMAAFLGFPAGTQYASYSGTSMASPHVAGTAALVLAANPNISMSQLRGVLAYTGDRIPGLEFTTTTGRRLNAANALAAALENDTTAPATVGNLRVAAPLPTGRNVALAWTASGDDGNSGTAADYDFFFVHPTTGVKTLMPTNLAPAPAGTQQTAVVTVPYRNISGTIILRVYDNAGNSSDTSVAATLPDNFRTNPYTVTLSGAPGLTPMSGTPLLTGDDKYTMYNMPFQFRFYGEVNAVTLSTNGAIYFSNPPRRDNGDADDSSSAVDALQGQRMIAGLWDDIDLSTSRRADAGIFVREADANHVVFRWQGVPCNPTQASEGACTGGNPVNFEIELRADGTIQMRYGAIASMFPVVGISGGEPDAYVVASHTSETVSKNLTNAQTITFTPRSSSLTISGTVTENGAPLSGVTMTLSGTQSATATTNAAGQYFFANLNVGASYTVTPSKPGYFFTPASQTFANNGLDALTGDFTGAPIPAGPNSVGLTQTTNQVGEGDGRATFTVTRTGDTSGTVSLDYRTVDSDTFNIGCADTVNNNGGAFARCDFAATVGRLSFAAGELSKTITVPLIDDGHDESAETFQLQLSNAVGSGTTLGAQNLATVTITDNDEAGARNPIITLSPADYPFFVRQQYLDFLSREPEPSEPWTAVMNRCPNVNTGPATNTDCDRIAVSRAFFEAPEFNLKGFYAFRFYKVAFARLPQYTEIVTDMSFLAGATEAEVYARRAQLANAFVARQEFTNLYGGMSNPQFVSTLLGRYGLTSVTTPDPFTPDSGTRVTLTSADLTSRLDSNLLTRAQIFRAIADSDQVFAIEFNSAFVAVQYYGYLRRTPEAAGYQANLDALQRGTSRREMINGFLNSTEYRLRFGQP